MVGSLFADTIKYTYNGELMVKENITLKRVDNKYIHYITSSKSFSKIECDKVVEITSTNGENIEFSCSKPSTVIQDSIINSKATVKSLILYRSVVGVSATVFGKAQRLNIGDFSNVN